MENTTHNGAELFLRYKKEILSQTRINSSEKADTLMRQFFDDDLIEYEETFIVAYLDNNNNLIGYFKASTGGMTGTLVDRRKIFSAGLLCGAVGIIIAHNHPSGTLKASQADKQMTQAIKKAGDIMDIRLLDHIIVTKNNGYLSFTDEGIL